MGEKERGRGWGGRTRSSPKRTLTGPVVLGLGMKKEARVQESPVLGNTENRVQVECSRCRVCAVGRVQNVCAESTFLIVLSEEAMIFKNRNVRLKSVRLVGVEVRVCL